MDDRDVKDGGAPQPGEQVALAAHVGLDPRLVPAGPLGDVGPADEDGRALGAALTREGQERAGGAALEQAAAGLPPGERVGAHLVGPPVVELDHQGAAAPAQPQRARIRQRRWALCLSPWRSRRSMCERSMDRSRLGLLGCGFWNAARLLGPVRALE